MNNESLQNDNPRRWDRAKKIDWTDYGKVKESTLENYVKIVSRLVTILVLFVLVVFLNIIYYSAFADFLPHLRASNTNCYRHGVSDFQNIISL